MLSPQESQSLLEAATSVLNQAYAIYSGFRVGAAVLTQSGNTYVGCNVENASYGLTFCAERAAIAAAVVGEGPQLRLVGIAIANERGATCPPCGACRQTIVEFGPQAWVIYRGKAGTEQRQAQELLPEPFLL
ncbi:MAG: cytidine deaminase [Chloroflexaceae bacterium]|nr:cytidine deaminase [Chloroflexaceae bacterium]